jgi:protein-S-isoprenylcysteine O-methyltransferase Ste14
MRMTLVMACLLFGAAWSLKYWQGWLFLVVFVGASFLVTLDIAQRDPELLQRRMKGGPGAEKEKSQKIIQLLASAGAVLLMLLSALDYRFGWSTVSASVAIAGNLLVALSFFIMWRVFRANSFTSSIIDVGEEQRVITAGPYRWVRHPMYAGALLMFAGSPPALGSYWGLLVSLFLTAIIIARLLYEERYLLVHLPGYPEYVASVRWRLVPGIW